MINFVIFGCPGAGKGTQAKLLAEKYGLYHLSSGELIRQGLKNSKLDEKVKRYIKRGLLVPDKLVNALVNEEVSQHEGKGFIFDGYPRKVSQVKALDKILSDHGAEVNLVINLKLTQKEALSRIIKRGKISDRIDDNIETSKNRLRIYRRHTAPLLKYYRKQGKVADIDGAQTIKQISRQIASITKKHLK